MKMSRSLLFLPAVLGAAVAGAETDQPTAPSPPPKATVLLGVGNAMGWFGLQGEGYFAGGRASVFGGLGYVPEFDRGWSGVAAAGGARLFTSGQKHRFFLEASVSLLAVEAPGDDSPIKGDEAFYGPGLQVGYQFVKPSGFTVMLSAGVGHIVGASPHRQSTAFIMGVGLGKTWRRR